MPWRCWPRKTRACRRRSGRSSAPARAAGGPAGRGDRRDSGHRRVRFPRSRRPLLSRAATGACRSRRRRRRGCWSAPRRRASGAIRCSRPTNGWIRYATAGVCRACSGAPEQEHDLASAAFADRRRRSDPRLGLIHASKEDMKKLVALERSVRASGGLRCRIQSRCWIPTAT